MLVSNISFSEFKDRIEKQFSNEFTEKEYRELVGETAKLYRDKHIIDRPEKTRNEQWNAWLKEAETYFGTVWSKVEQFDGAVVDTIAKGTAATIHAYAIHYRMHMHSNEDELKFADKIDKILFKAPLREFGRAVFGIPILKPTAPFKWPPHVSKENAFSQKAHEGIWLNPHNHFSIPLSGRDKEKKRLEEFIDDDRHFIIGAVIAPSGAGKTRLISEWMRSYMAKYENNNDWDAGFVVSRDASLWGKDNWKPTKNTLIIIDYTYNYDEVMGVIIDRFKDHAQFKIRLLVLDHVLPEKLHEDFAWGQVIEDQGFLDSQPELSPKSFLIELKAESDRSILLRDVIAHAIDPYAETNQYDRNSDIVVDAFEALISIGNTINTSPTKEEIRTRDSIRHPLFAALIGQFLSGDSKPNFSSWSRRDLITHYFERPQRIPWRKHDLNKYAESLGPWVGCYVCTATLLRGATVPNLEAQLPETVAEALTDAQQLSSLVDYANRIIAGDDVFFIKPFEPDILGETFFLKFIENYRAKKVVLETLCSMLTLSSSTNLDERNATAFLETIQRLVRNLINDNQQDKSVIASWIALLNFMKPERFPKTKLLRQTVSVALGDMIKQCRNAGLESIIPKFVDQVNVDDLCDASTGMFLNQSAIGIIHYFDWMVVEDRIDNPLEIALTCILKKYEERSISPLMMVAYEGCLNTTKYVQQLLDEDIYSRQNQEWEILIVVAEMGHDDIVGWFLDKGVDPNFTGVRNIKTALMCASHAGHVDAVERLIKANATVDQALDNGITALLAAAMEGHIDIVGCLINAGATVDQALDNGVTALMAASALGHVDMIGRLIDAGAVVDQGTRENGTTALMSACELGHIGAVRRLIDAGANVNQGLTDNGKTALMIACVPGHIDIVECLINAGAFVDQRTTDNGITALIIASLKGHANIAKCLIDAGATVDQERTDNGATALMTASQAGYVDIVERLIIAGATVNLGATNNGWTALLAAIAAGHINIVERLILAGALVNQGTRDTGTTALMFACQSRRNDIVEFLISAGASIDQGTTDNGTTALMFSCRSGHNDTVELLANAGASINQGTTDNGVTALMIASALGHVDIVECLISHGAFINIRVFSDGKQVTPLSLAHEFGHLNVAMVLIKFGAK